MMCLVRIVQLTFTVLILIPAFEVDAQDAYPMEIKIRSAVGGYEVARWKQDWPGCKSQNGISEGRVSIVDAFKMKWMRVTCQADQVGPEKGGIRWRRPIPPCDRIEMAYYVKFSADFDFAGGGTLPGLCGGTENVIGEKPANGKNGFSARFRWRPDGRGEAYIYHMDQPDKFGESILFSDDFRFPRNKPLMIIMRVGMNELDELDGTFEAWVKLGEEVANKVIHRDSIRWRSVETVQIDSLLCEVAYDPKDAKLAPKKNGIVDLADFLLLE